MPRYAPNDDRPRLRANRRAGSIVICVLGALAVAWMARDPAVDAPTPPDVDAVAPLVHTEPGPAPTPRAPPKHTSMYIATTSEGATWREARFTPNVASGPAFIQDLDQRYGGPPDPWMIAAIEGAGMDFNDLAWMAGGLSPWSDLVLLRSASAVSWATGDAQTRAEVQQLIHEASQRWPEHGQLAALAPGPMPNEERGAWARELLDRGRRGELLPWTAVNVAVSLLDRRSEGAQADDHQRFQWAVQGYPRHRAYLVATALGLALRNHQPEHAAHWLAELEQLEPQELQPLSLGHREMHSLRLGVVAIGGLAPHTWAERTAREVGSCFDQLSPRHVGAFVRARALWRSGIVTWLPAGDEPWSTELATCLEGRTFEAPEEGDHELDVLFLWRW